MISKSVDRTNNYGVQLTRSPFCHSTDFLVHIPTSTNFLEYEYKISKNLSIFPYSINSRTRIKLYLYSEKKCWNT